MLWHWCRQGSRRWESELGVEIQRLSSVLIGKSRHCGRSALSCLLPTAYCLLFSGKGTSLKSARGINGIGAFVNVANDAVFVDHESDAVGEKASETEDTVRLGHFLFGVAQEGETRSGLLGKLAVSFLAIETNP